MVIDEKYSCFHAVRRSNKRADFDPNRNKLTLSPERLDKIVNAAHDVFVGQQSGSYLLRFAAINQLPRCPLDVGLGQRTKSSLFGL